MTPWGKPNHVYDVAAGIAEVSGVGHGGVKLSAERNKLIHPALRNSSGWYEEDCEWNIPAAAFANEWVAHRNPDGTATGMFASADALRESANDSIRSWFPDQFEKATGQKVLPGQSSVRDEAVFWKEHQQDQVVISASTADTDPSMVRVTAASGIGQESQAEFLVPRQEYDSGKVKAGHMNRFIVDPARHRRLPDLVKIAPAIPPLHHTVPGYGSAAPAGQSSAASERIAKDMNPRWRSADGTVRSLREVVQDEGVSSRTAYVDGMGKRTYALIKNEDGHAYSYHVSRATFDAMADVPDDRSEWMRAYQDATVADENARKARESAWSSQEREKAQKSADRAKELQAKADALYPAERARGKAASESLTRDTAARERAATIQPNL